VLLEKKAHGLNSTSNVNREIEHAEAIHRLEAAALKELIDFYQIFRGPLVVGSESWMVEMSLQRAYRLIRVAAERNYEDMIRYIDVRLPGPNGRQAPVSGPQGLLFLPNYRREETLTDSQRAELYRERVERFNLEGGDRSQILDLNPELVNRLGSYTRLEYVWTADGQIRVTDGEAGHIILADGEAVRGAGQLLILKDRTNHPTFAVVSNASGNYKPDLASALALAIELGPRLGLHLSRIVTTSGEPAGVQAVKTYAKALAHPEAKRKASEAKELQRRWLGSGRVPRICIGLVDGRSRRYD
jgi:hypothetical protein